MIEFRHVWQEYGDQVVLERLNFTIEKGSFVTIVGASGCGKSTLLRMLLGTEQPARGQILLNGLPMGKEPAPDRGIVFQKYSVFPHLTVRENVLIGLELSANKWIGKLFGATRAKATQQAEDMLKAVGLNHAMEKYPSALSGGMQQRLAIAQALVMKPKVLLLDEPFAALDPGIRREMQDLLLELCEQTGVTVFMVTHDLDEGFRLGTRLMVVDKVHAVGEQSEQFGATVTYDLPLSRTKLKKDTKEKMFHAASGLVKPIKVKITESAEAA